MIKVNIVYKDKRINKIVVNGHANYDVSGKDIVCAAVSSTVITTVNNILSLKDTIEYNESDGKLLILVKIDDDNTDKLLNNMINMLKELECNYPKNIKII